MCLADATLAVCDPKKFHLENRVSLSGAKFREVRFKGRGVLRISLPDGNLFYVR